MKEYISMLRRSADTIALKESSQQYQSLSNYALALEVEYCYKYHP